MNAGERERERERILEALALACFSLSQIRNFLSKDGALELGRFLFGSPLTSKHPKLTYIIPDCVTRNTPGRRDGSYFDASPL